MVLQGLQTEVWDTSHVIARDASGHMAVCSQLSTPDSEPAVLI